MYKVILADPPWSYEQGKNLQGGIDHQYPILKDKDIIDLPIGDLAEKDSLLFMWCTWPKLEIGIKCLDSWGFKYITAPSVWVKTNADGSPFHGIGFWTLGGSEFILLGRKGKGIKRNPETKGRQKQVVSLPRTKHSEKPGAFHNIVDDLTGSVGPRIELFARREPPQGWDATGYDYDGKDIREFISERVDRSSASD